MTPQKIKYPIGIQDFRKLREDGYIYVDKTDIVYDLVKNSQYFFFARPRRFGKSLLLSTLKYYFEGRKELFEGLKIMELEKDWRRHPVLHLSLASLNADNDAGLNSALEEQFSEWEDLYGINESNFDFAQRFARIIKAAYNQTGEKVVVLIDEYDNPLINTLHRDDLHHKNRELLKSVYSNLKDQDAYIKFGFLTGVSRFSSLTIFSGLNNLMDVTFDDRFADLCGFSDDEIKEYLFAGVEKLAECEGISAEEAMDLLKKYYDGYHFSTKLIDVYNPFSLLNCLHNSKIENYWFKSGAPSFLIKKLEENKDSFTSIFNAESDSMNLGTVDAAFHDPVSLLFQTGYLTIKSYNKRFDEFKLGIPNREVEKSLMLLLLGRYRGKNSSELMKPLILMAECLENGQPEEFIGRLRSILAPISYHFKNKLSELDFERVMFVILHLLGLEVTTELHTSWGRIDVVVKTGKYIYIMELKLDKSAREALDQIENKEYALQWDYDGRKVIKIGINFSSEQRNITEWEIKDN